ncbi:DUF2812 domain-containing protein [Ornithinibacillus bavariensis]|uniref:DUF2812 domain-containing protein n=1 Tax=Ornithinibacillus bavariensis TaxID=545502 RepID=UPI000EDB6346|nr:hypothetical protein [Ornithinibacillus sp.]
MAKRKFRLFLGSDVGKEEEWLTEMSRNGLHLQKYQLFSYTFEEDPEKSYVYQIDFQQNVKDDYLQLYKDAGWEYVTNAINAFHYFRTETSNKEVRKLYSDKESIRDSFNRMIRFYVTIFLCFLVSQLGIFTGLFTSWKSYPFFYTIVGVDAVVIVLYVYVLLSLRKRVQSIERK